MYNKKTIDHFSNPRNMGELKDFDAKAEGGNPLCGDVVKLWIKLSEDRVQKTEDRKIADIKFKAFGCGACIASASAMTEMVKEKSLKFVQQITKEKIADYLGGLPAQKMICSNFSAEVLKKALGNTTNFTPACRRQE